VIVERPGFANEIKHTVWWHCALGHSLSNHRCVIFVSMATQLPEVGQWTTILLSAGRHHKHLMSPEMDEGESVSLSCFKNWFHLLRAIPQHSISLSVRESLSEQSLALSVGLSEEPNVLEEACCSRVQQI